MFSDPCSYVVGCQTWMRCQCPRAPEVEVVALLEAVAPRTRWRMWPMVVVSRLLNLTLQQVQRLSAPPRP
jgi:hypothetical protein